MKKTWNTCGRFGAVVLAFVAAALAADSFISANARAKPAQAGEKPGKEAIGPRAMTAGKCTPANVAFKATDEVVTTSSSSAADIPGTRVKFKLAQKSCVLVRFSGEASAPAGFAIGMHARLDGTTVLAPGFIQFSADDDAYYHAHTYEFVLNDVPPGKHRVDIRWATTGGTAFMGERNTVVQYR